LWSILYLQQLGTPWLHHLLFLAAAFIGVVHDLHLGHKKSSGSVEFEYNLDKATFSTSYIFFPFSQTIQIKEYSKFFIRCANDANWKTTTYLV
jgi:hypothetical protein